MVPFQTLHSQSCLEVFECLQLGGSLVAVRSSHSILAGTANEEWDIQLLTPKPKSEDRCYAGSNGAGSLAHFIAPLSFWFQRFLEAIKLNHFESLFDLLWFMSLRQGAVPGSPGGWCSPRENAWKSHEISKFWSTRCGPQIYWNAVGVGWGWLGYKHLKHLSDQRLHQVLTRPPAQNFELRTAITFAHVRYLISLNQVYSFY